ncbi:ABC transporter ATP-binding protein [Pseudomonas sp. Pseusp3]|uniref:ABC transporter ATP-binding protein n=1 Tax=unclassified Pseudomonas TaxID=196821 RepID=UPI0039AF2215
MNNTTIESLISLKGINKGYKINNNYLPILQDVFLTIKTGESCALLGASGSGKSTLLNILGLLDSVDAGEYRFAGHDVCSATPDELAAIRNQQIGFVFQSFNLIPRLNAIENVALPLRYRSMKPGDARQRAQQMLAEVGLEQRAHHRPADLSGGQRQRLAIARALVGQPSLILADEPTGNLDPGTADDIMDLLISLNRAHDVTLVVVTHDSAIARRLNRQIRVTNGAVQELCPCPA